MAFSKISSYILYVVGVISLLVMLFFYIAPNTVDVDALDLRVEELTTAPEVQDITTPVIDSIAVDSLDATDETMAEADSAAAPLVEEEVPVETASVSVKEIDLRDHMSGWEYMVYKRTDLALRWSYILLVLTALAAVVFPLINLVTNTKALVRTLMILAGAAVLVLVSYFVDLSDAVFDLLLNRIRLIQFIKFFIEILLTKFSSQCIYCSYKFILNSQVFTISS